MQSSSHLTHCTPVLTYCLSLVCLPVSIMYPRKMPDKRFKSGGGVFNAVFRLFQACVFGSAAVFPNTQCVSR